MGRILALRDESRPCLRLEKLLFTVPAFAAINVVLVGAWLAVAAMLNASTEQKAAAAPPTRVS